VKISAKNEPAKLSTLCECGPINRPIASPRTCDETSRAGLGKFLISVFTQQSHASGEAPHGPFGTTLPLISRAARHVGPRWGLRLQMIFFLPPCLSLFDTWSGSWLPVWPAVGVEGILHAVERPVSRKRGPQHKSNPHGPGSLRQSSSHANGSPLLVKARFFVESRTTRWCLHQAESYETLSLLPHPFTIGLRARL